MLINIISKFSLRNIAIHYLQFRDTFVFIYFKFPEESVPQSEPGLKVS